MVQVVRVSGTIKKVEEEAIRRARAAILRAKVANGEGTRDSLMNLMGEDDNTEDGNPTMIVQFDSAAEEKYDEVMTDSDQGD